MIDFSKVNPRVGLSNWNKKPQKAISFSEEATTAAVAYYGKYSRTSL